MWLGRFSFCLVGVFLVGGCGGSSSTSSSEEPFSECRPGEDGIIDCTVSLPEPDFGFQMKTDPRIIEPGQEEFTCSILKIPPLDGENLMWVNEIQSLSSDGSHHMNVYFSPDWTFADAFGGDGLAELILGKEFGTHDCGDLGDLMESAFPFAPSQRTFQQLQFPNRVAMPWFTPAVVVIEHHFINTTSQPHKINAAVNFMQIESSEVDDLIGILWASDWNINIPPEHQSLTVATCLAPFDANVAIMSTHTHARGQCATVNRYNSSTNLVDPDPFFVNKDWERPPILHFPRGEYNLKKGDGFHYGCHYYNNEKDRTITGGGTSFDEMCMAVAGIYPLQVTKADVIAVAESLNLPDALDLIDNMILSCDRPDPKPETPWEMAGQELPGPPVDNCVDLPETIGNVLR